jgi:hypothetical protein
MTTVRFHIVMHVDDDLQRDAANSHSTSRFSRRKSMSRVYTFAIRHSQVIRVASMFAVVALSIIAHRCADPIPLG